MYYHASAIIAERHPDLAGLVASLDGYVHSLSNAPIDSETLADLLDADAGAVARLVRLYVDAGLLAAQTTHLCPNDLDPLESDGDGGLWCGLCETAFDRETAIETVVYRVCQAPDGQPEAAASPAARGHALVIGVNEYGELPRLSTPVSDASALAAFLASPMGAGLAPANVHLLLDQQATRPAISLALEWLARSTTCDDQVIVYFAGHGIRRLGGLEPGEYLCPFATAGDHLRSTAIHAGELSAALAALPAGQVLVLLDACYAGGLVDVEQAWQRTYYGLTKRAYGRLAHSSGHVLIASSRIDEVSWELASLKRGLFTHYLLAGLQGSAAGEDGAVRVLDLYTYLAKHMAKHRSQHPVLKGELDDNFVVVPAARRRPGH